MAAALVIAVAGGGYAAWRLTKAPAPAPAADGKPSAATAAPVRTPQPPTAAPATPDSQVRNTGAVASGADHPAGSANASTETHPAAKPVGQPTPPVSTPARQSPAVVQSATISPKPPQVTVAPTVTTTPRDTKQLEPTAPPAAAPPRIDPSADVERTEAAHVRETVESYVRAIGDKRMDLLRELFPGMSEEYRRGYEAMFASASDLSTRVSGTPTITVHGTTADAQFAYELEGRDPSRGNFNRHFSLRARLQRTDQRWILTSLEAAP